MGHLESAKVYFENVINSINDIIIVMDKDFKVSFVNSARYGSVRVCERRFSWERSEVLNGINQDLNNYETIFVSKYGRKIPRTLSCFSDKR